MSLTLKKTIVNVGYGIETLGNITLIAAMVFGSIAPIVALIAYTQKNDRSKHVSHRNYNFFMWFESPRACHYHPREHYAYSKHSNANFYLKFIGLSLILSMIGVVLAIALQVYWVGITVVALWASGLALSALGRGLINIGLNWEDRIEPIINTSDAQEQTRVTPEAVSVDNIDAPSFPEATPTQEAIPVNGIDTPSDTEGRWVPYHTPFIAQCVGYCARPK